MCELLAEQFAVEPSEVTMDTSFEEDLGADSVDLVELVMAMEEEFELGESQEEDLGKLKTVGDAVNFVAGKIK
jgi:acyl carrier protein